MRTMTNQEFREARRRLGLTQLELGRIMGMSQAAICDLERESSTRRPTKIQAAFLLYIVAHPPRGGAQ